jgi:hypothetical protein
MDSGKLRLIDVYENKDKPIDWYFPYFGYAIDSNYSYNDYDIAMIMKTKEFKKAVHFGDPDVSKRSLLTGTTTRQALEEAGIYVQTNTESNDFASRREKTKVLLQQGIEVNRTKGTEYWMDCIKEARYPQRQETSQATKAISKPVHDWTSHNRTALEYFAVNYEGKPQDNPVVKEQVQRRFSQKHIDPNINVIPEGGGMMDIF